MDTQQIDVMVADASHEVYVDTILETIRNAAAVRGTGIAERTHEYVATKMKEGKAIIALCGDDFAGFPYMGKQAICGYFRSDRSSRFPWVRTGKTHQTGFFPTGTSPMAESKNIQSDLRSSCHEDEHRTGLCACHLQRTDRRRSFLERMRRMYQP